MVIGVFVLLELRNQRGARNCRVLVYEINAFEYYGRRERFCADEKRTPSYIRTPVTITYLDPDPFSSPTRFYDVKESRSEGR